MDESAKTRRRALFGVLGVSVAALVRPRHARAAPVPPPGSAPQAAGGQQVLREELGAKGDSRLMGWSRGKGAATRSVADKLSELSVSPEDFGAIGDGKPNGEGSDDIEALERARDWLDQKGGGTLQLSANKFYAVSRDFVIESKAVDIRGWNSRSGGIVGLPSGRFKDAVVRVGGAKIAFSNDLTNLGIYAPNLSVPALMGVSLQENCTWSNLVIRGSNGWVLVLKSLGAYLGGNIYDTPCHKARLSDLHIITSGTGDVSRANGVRMLGCLAVICDNWTVTVPVFADKPRAPAGAIGLQLDDASRLNAISELYVEGFATPVLLSGAGSVGNRFTGLSAFANGVLPDEATILRVTSGKYAPLVVESISNLSNRYPALVEVAQPSLRIDAKDVLEGQLSRLRIAAVQGAVGRERGYFVETDTLLHEMRTIEYAGMRTDRLVVLPANDPRPSVAGGNLFETANSGAVAYQDFTGGRPGQRITAILTGAGDSIAHGARIRLRGGGSRKGPDYACSFVQNGNGVWVEV